MLPNLGRSPIIFFFFFFFLINPCIDRNGRLYIDSPSVARGLRYYSTLKTFCKFYHFEFFRKFWNFDLFRIWPRWPDYCASLRSRIPPVTPYWFPVASFPVQGILSINFLYTILTQIYGPMNFFQSRSGADPDSQKRGQIGVPKPKLFVVFKGLSPKRGPSPSCRLCTQPGVV